MMVATIQQPKYLDVARGLVRMIVSDMPNIKLDPSEIKHWQLITNGDESILLATLNINVANPERYQAATHRIGTLVRSRMPWAKAAWVNSTGWRWAIRLSRVKPLPSKVIFPGVAAETIRLGMQRDGSEVSFDWRTFDQHLIIAGMTRSGKSACTRMVVYQAMSAGGQVMIADMKERTFLAFEQHPSLMCPIAMTPADADALIDQVRGEIEHRKALFNQLPGLHEKLSEYNDAAIKAGKPVLPRLLVVLDEYLFAINALGGPRGKFAQKVWDVVRVGLAYGINVVLTTQDIGKDDLGGLRDQFGMVICFRTKNADTARNLRVGPAATIPDGRPGMAYCDPFGWMQVYYLDKKMLTDGVPAQSQSDDEEKLFKAAQEHEWRVTRSLIQSALGLSERAAKKLQNDLAQRGWLVKDGGSDNAFCISERWKSAVGHGWTGLDGVGPVGRWTESMPKTGEEEK